MNSNVQKRNWKIYQLNIQFVYETLLTLKTEKEHMSMIKKMSIECNKRKKERKIERDKSPLKLEMKLKLKI